MELASRASYRGQVTKLIKNATDYLKSGDSTIQTNADNLDEIAEELTVLLDRLTAAHGSLCKANAEVVSLLKQDDLCQCPPAAAETPHDSTSATATLSSPSPRASSNAVKLQKLQPKRFSGDFKDWVPFWEQYRVLVHENASLSTIDKFNYLETVLVGKAAETLAGLTPTEANYTTAITLLKEEYGNNEKIVDYTMQRLLSIQPVTSKADVFALRRLYTSVLASTRSLASLGIPSANYFVMLKGVLLRCIPNELRIDFHRYYEDSNANPPTTRAGYEDDDASNSSESLNSTNFIGDRQVKCLLQFLKREIESLEKANEAKPHPSRSNAPNLRPVKTALGLFAADKREDCFFCNAVNHQTKDCNCTKGLAEKKQLLKNGGRCYRCCTKGHNSKMCRVKGIVCKTCNGRHATTMCDPLFTKLNSTPTQTTSEKATRALESASSLNLFTTEKIRQGKVYLQTACAYISSEFSPFSMVVRIVMDGGSQLSFVKSTLARRLDLPVVGVHRLNLIAFGSNKPLSGKLCNKVRIVLRSQYDDQAVVIDAIEVPEICVDVLSMPTNDPTVSFQNLKLADALPQGGRTEDGISVLVGADTYWQFATGEHRRLTNKLTAINTILGWTIQGPSTVTTNVADSSPTTSLDVCVCEDVQRFWQLDVLGIVPEGKKSINNDVFPHIRRRGDRFEASLPWKPLSDTLHDNRTSALVRLQSLIRKLCSAGRIAEYDASMQEMMTSGIAEIVPETSASENRVYYLPHRPVYREDKETTKLRIVFDASSHAPNHLSLNDFLEVGENLLADLLAVLLSFRVGKVGIIADIEKAFLQILLHPADRDSHRFLWFGEKIINSTSLPTIKTYRMTRLTFGVKSSPYILGCMIKELINEAKKQSEMQRDVVGKLRRQKVCELLQTSFYMDDFIASVENEEINLLEATTVQGTKRNILRVMAKIFDPFGILAPFTVRFKIIFQNIWRRNLDWDEILPSDMQNIWATCKNEIYELNDMVISRHLLSNEHTTQIHVFADASQFAFGAVAYSRTVHSNGEVSVQLICAKNRVAPLKNNTQSELTIPKLELTAALVAARLFDYLHKNLRINIVDVYFWTDSQIALYWILGKDKRWKPYVENRVQEIRALSKISSWRHCPGLENPADLLTRGISAAALSNSLLWLGGPSWLKDEELRWPLSTYNKTSSVSVCMLASHQIDDEERDLDGETFDSGEPIINSEDFSTWRRLLRVTAYVLRAIDAFKFKRKSTKYLSAEEINRAEKYWVKQVQWMHFSKEIVALRRKKGMPSDSKVISLSPFLDNTEQFLRVGGRLQQVVTDVKVAHPIILPKSAYITKLLVIDAHDKTFHGGPSTTLARLRCKYWVIRGRQLIKTITKSCFVCKVLRGKSAKQVFAPLPMERILASRPFEVTGIDFAGPLYVTNKNNERKKIYILLFTCAAIRAVHIECTEDLTTESCLLALRRFIARRGVPRIIYSDNATTFKKASSELNQINKMRNDENFLGFLSDSQIRWKFIVERATWWGGFWERLVGVVKCSLRAAIRRATLNTDQLYTLLTEVECVVNSRPLTYSGDDPLDLEPLTPSHFLHGAPSTSNDSSETRTGKELRKQWKERLQFLAAFKRRWFKEYLHQLRSLHHTNNSKGSSLKIGDVVLVEDSSLPRTLWHLAVIQKTFPGRDGKTRACEIRLASGSILRRPIQLLYPLEINHSS